MNSFSLSDILRHIITGAFFLFFLVIGAVLSYYKAPVPTDYALPEVDNVFSEGGWFWLIVLVVCYPLGIIIQSLNKLFQRRKRRGLINFLFCQFSIRRQSLWMKANPKHYTPEWVLASTRPGKLVEYIEMEIENKKNAVINEFFYLCELFQGLYLSSFILLVGLYIPQLILGFPRSIAWDSLLMGVTGVLLVTAVLSYEFAKFYAKRFIISMDIYKEVLNINIEKYMHKLGVQRVFVMMRARSEGEFLDEAIHSVFRQNYYHIDLVILEDGDEPVLKDKIAAISGEYKDKNVQVYHYHTVSGSPAASSYAIRNIILNMADQDDDIIFILDEDDLFAHSNAVSDVVYEMNKKGASVCLVKYNVIGEPTMNIARQGGDTHNDIARKLHEFPGSQTIDDYPKLHLASSMGWSKIYRMEVLREYFVAINTEREQWLQREPDVELESYEDFPDFLIFLFLVEEEKKGKKKKGKKNENETKKKVAVTGMETTAYLYRKHKHSVTRTIHREAFRTWRMNQLRLLVLAAGTLADNGQLIDTHRAHVSRYLTAKIEEILTIIDKYNAEGLLPDYTRVDFEAELKAYPEFKPYYPG